MEASRTTTPVILSGSAVLTLTAGVPSAPVGFSSDGLVNTLSDPIELRDLVIATTVQATVVTQVPTEISLRAGRHGMTNGLVPVTSIAPLLEAHPSGAAILAAAVTISTATRRWIFSRPLILRSGESLAGIVGLSPLGSYGGATGTVTTRIAARGCRIPASAVSRVTAYPFCSGAWLPNLGVSTQDLTYRNLFPVPLNVAHIVSNFSTPTAFTLGGNVEIIGPGGLSGGSRRAIVPNGTQSSLVFTQQRALSVPFILQPNESLRVTFTTAPTDTPLPAVSIVGYREEAA